MRDSVSCRRATESGDIPELAHASDPLFGLTAAQPVARSVAEAAHGGPSRALSGRFVCMRAVAPGTPDEHVLAAVEAATGADVACRQ